MNFLKKLISDKTVKRRYIQAGGNFGLNVSELAMLGENIDFNYNLNRFARWEKEYAQRGYRTISIDDFIELGGYGADISCLIGVKREEGEVPVYHAQIYKDQFLGKFDPMITAEEIDTGENSYGIMGTYGLPSTKEYQNKQ